MALSFARPSFKTSFVAILLLLASLSASAQAYNAAVRQERINVFAIGAVSNTDYGSNDRGVTIGGDFTRHYRLLDSSLTVRYNKMTGEQVGEKSFAGGLKLERGFGRYHPYGQMMIGYGVITFNHPVRNQDGSLYTYDDSKIYDAGLGLDVDLNRSFAVKVDAQYQHWKLGASASSALTPSIVGVGLIYRIPYRSLRPRNY